MVRSVFLGLKALTLLSNLHECIIEIILKYRHLRHMNLAVLVTRQVLNADVDCLARCAIRRVISLLEKLLLSLCPYW